MLAQPLRRSPSLASYPMCPLVLPPPPDMRRSPSVQPSDMRRIPSLHPHGDRATALSPQTPVTPLKMHEVKAIESKMWADHQQSEHMCHEAARVSIAVRLAHEAAAAARSEQIDICNLVDEIDKNSHGIYGL